MKGLQDYIRLINSMYVKSVLEDSHLRIFTKVFKKVNEIHNYATRPFLRNSVNITQPNTETYDRYSIKHQCATSWNNLLTRMYMHNIYIYIYIYIYYIHIYIFTIIYIIYGVHEM